MIVGARRNFGHRFQTNNYGISARIALSEHLLGLKDHVLGSVYASEQNFNDVYFDVLISATNKTPCSANAIAGLAANRATYIASIDRYIQNLQRLQIPEELSWMAEPLNETSKLFKRI